MNEVVQLINHGLSDVGLTERQNLLVLHVVESRFYKLWILGDLKTMEVYAIGRMHHTRA